MLEVLTPLETIPGNAISSLTSEQGERESNLVPSKIHDLMTIMTNPSASATLQEIKISGEQQGQTSLDILEKNAQHGRHEIESSRSI